MSNVSTAGDFPFENESFLQRNGALGTTLIAWLIITLYSEWEKGTAIAITSLGITRGLK